MSTNDEYNPKLEIMNALMPFFYARSSAIMHDIIPGCHLQGIFQPALNDPYLFKVSAKIVFNDDVSEIVKNQSFAQLNEVNDGMLGRPAIVRLLTEHENSVINGKNSFAIDYYAADETDKEGFSWATVYYNDTDKLDTELTAYHKFAAGAHLVEFLMSGILIDSPLVP